MPSGQCSSNKSALFFRRLACHWPAAAVHPGDVCALQTPVTPLPFPSPALCLSAIASLLPPSYRYHALTPPLSLRSEAFNFSSFLPTGCCYVQAVARGGRDHHTRLRPQHVVVPMKIPRRELHAGRGGWILCWQKLRQGHGRLGKENGWPITDSPFP